METGTHLPPLNSPPPRHSPTIEASAFGGFSSLPLDVQDNIVRLSDLPERVAISLSSKRWKAPTDAGVAIVARLSRMIAGGAISPHIIVRISDRLGWCDCVQVARNLNGWVVLTTCNVKVPCDSVREVLQEVMRAIPELLEASPQGVRIRRLARWSCTTHTFGGPSMSLEPAPWAAPCSGAIARLALILPEVDYFEVVVIMQQGTDDVVKIDKRWGLRSCALIMNRGSITQSTAREIVQLLSEDPTFRPAVIEYRRCYEGDRHYFTYPGFEARHPAWSRPLSRASPDN